MHAAPTDTAAPVEQEPAAPAPQKDPAAASDAERVDVAVNIFAKPYQTALALLSLLRQSGAHVGTVWLQYEPMGSRYDSISPYVVTRYLQEVLNWPCRVSQPDFWLAREAVDTARLGDAVYRMGIRYQYAFENSESRKLLLMHNDVFLFRDALGDMLAAMGRRLCHREARAMLELPGQCGEGGERCHGEGPLHAGELRGVQAGCRHLAAPVCACARTGRFRAAV